MTRFDFSRPVGVVPMDAAAPVTALHRRLADTLRYERRDRSGALFEPIPASPLLYASRAEHPEAFEQKDLNDHA